MSAIVICMASAKGGSGKTTLTATFATFLSEIGRKVLMVDCDEATNGLTLLYLSQVNRFSGSDDNILATGLFDDIVNETGGIDKIFGVINIMPYVDLIPATFHFIPRAQVTSKDFHARLSYIVRNGRESYDYILLDAQAGSDIVSQTAVRRDISDEVIVVSEYDPLSAAGVERLKAIMGEDLNFTRTWMLLNKMLPEFVKSFSEFLSVARYLPPIPWTADVVRAYSKRELALDFEIGNSFTLAAMRTLKALVPHRDRLEFDRWAENRASSLRQPIDEQYADQQSKVKFIYMQLAEADRRNRVRNLLVGTASAAASFLTFSIGIFFAVPGFVEAIGDYVSERANQLYLFSSVIAVVGGASVLLFLLIRIFSVRNSVERKVEMDMLTRQREIAEAELTKLEALKNADLESIIERRAQLTGF